MTRFFYTDPLAAAWMSEHYGMKFVNDLPEGQQHAIHIYGVGKWCADSAGYKLQRQRTTCPPRFHIYPGSMHLLKPQDGDIIQSPCKRHAVFISDNRFIPASQCVADAIANVRDYGFAVIQRSGKAFMWPESEAA